MRVLFAPDYRDGNCYQNMLANALQLDGVSTEFLSDYRRGMPLWRGVAAFNGDLLHLHWPEKYYQRRADGFDLLRRARYPIDLRLALGRMPLVLTVHDLLPHNRGTEAMLHRNYQYTLTRAKAIFAHSTKAASALSQTYDVEPGKCHVIPHGDLSTSPLPDRIESRTSLSLPQSEAICLMFGRAEPYKGIEDVIDCWGTQPGVTLAIVGEPLSKTYANQLRELARGRPGVHLCLEWQPEERFRTWLAAADCVLFNYTKILTSGAACEARSYGIPILLPHRLATIDLMEPHASVFRFHTMERDFRQNLSKALSASRDYDSAREWREATSWRRVAKATSEIYRATANKPLNGAL